MTRGSIDVRLAVVGAVAALLAQQGWVQSAEAVTPTTLYASSTGSGATCTALKPCTLPEALTTYQAGDTISVLPGAYGSTTTPYATSLADAKGAVTIEGEAGKPGAVVITTAASVGVDLTSNSTLRDVTVVSIGNSDVAIEADSGLVDHVIATESGSNGFACKVFNATLSDSLCEMTGTFGAAVGTYTLGSGAAQTYSPVIRGVTAIATGGDSSGLSVVSGQNTTIHAVATNSIFKGINDIYVTTINASSVTTLSTSHCAYGVVQKNAAVGSTDTFTGDPSDTMTPPQFVDAAHGNYAELASSPTVNAGVADPSGDTDLFGAPRTLGSAPDIGAVELAQKPTAGSLHLANSTKTTLHFSLTEDPEGLPTTITVTASRPHHAAVHKTVPGGSGLATKIRKFVLHHLTSGAKYHVTVVVHNAVGSAKHLKVVASTR